MTLIALQARVGSRQSETRGRVIKGRPAPPGRRRVALIARLRESRGHVVGRCRILEVRQVATDASCRRCDKVSVEVALCARHRVVGACQLETAQVVIERGALPTRGVVARLAGRRKIAGNMGRIIGLCIVQQVAAHAGRRSAGEFTAHVTLRARHARMHAG